MRLPSEKLHGRRKKPWPGYHSVLQSEPGYHYTGDVKNHDLVIIQSEPPKVSTTSGRKTKPCPLGLHASSASSSLSLWALSKAKPALWAAPGIVQTLKGVLTLASMAASFLPVQIGTRKSAWRRSLPGVSENTRYKNFPFLAKSKVRQDFFIDHKNYEAR